MGPGSRGRLNQKQSTSATSHRTDVRLGRTVPSLYNGLSTSIGRVGGGKIAAATGMPSHVNPGGSDSGLPARDVAGLRRDGGGAGRRADRPAVRRRVTQQRDAGPVAQPPLPRGPDPGAVHNRGDRRDLAGGTAAPVGPGRGTAGG